MENTARREPFEFNGENCPITIESDFNKFYIKCLRLQITFSDSLVLF